MGRFVIVLFALIQADLPVRISSASLRSARTASFPEGYAPDSPAGYEEEEEQDDPMDKEQVLQVVQTASEQAPDLKQKQAFLAWLAAGRTTVAPSERAVEYPVLQQAASTYDSSSFAFREEPVKGEAKEEEVVAKKGEEPLEETPAKKGEEPVEEAPAKKAEEPPAEVVEEEKAPAKGAVEETVAKEPAKGEAVEETVAKDGGSKAAADVPKGNSSAAVEGSDNTCSPACAEGRGLCSDKVCFCRSPYTGVTCEKFREVGSVRVGPGLLAAIAVFASLVGMIMAINVFKFFVATPLGDLSASSPAEGESNTKETWRPAQGK